MLWKRAILALLVMAIGFGPARLLLGADILDAIPRGALAVVLINRLEATSDKIESLATKVQAPSVSLLLLAKVQSGIHEGLDEKGTAAIAYLPVEDNPMETPIPIVVLPVTDYGKFVAQLQPDDATEKIAQVYVAGKAVLSCQKGDFAVLTTAENQAVLKDVLASVKSVSDDLAPLRTWLAEVDAAAVATPTGIKTVSDLMGDNPLTEAAGTLIQAAGDELNLAAIGVRADDNGTVRVTTRLRMTPGGQWATVVSAMSATGKGLLSGLPAGPFDLAAGIQYNEPMRNLAKWFVAGDGAMMNPVFAKLPAEKLAKLREIGGRMMGAIDSVRFWSRVGKPDDPLLASGVTIIKVVDAKKYLADFEALNQLQLVAGDGARRFQVDGRDALDVVTDLSAAAGGDSAPEGAMIKPIMVKFFGTDDKLHNYIAAVDDQTLVSTYGGEDKLREAIAALCGGKSTAPPVRSPATSPRCCRRVAGGGVGDAEWRQPLGAGVSIDIGQIQRHAGSD